MSPSSSNGITKPFVPFTVKRSVPGSGQRQKYPGAVFTHSPSHGLPELHSSMSEDIKYIKVDSVFSYNLDLIYV